MMARCARSEGSIAKLVSVTDGNGALGMPVVQGVAVWFDNFGRPSLIIDGATLTSLRTGAASGAATSRMAPAEARCLAVLGSGGQAWDQVEAVLAVRPIEEVHIASRNAATASALAARLREEHESLTVSVAAGTREAVRGADVICCATTARHPIFEAGDLKQNAHINAIGAFTPSMSEVPGDVLAQAVPIVVDQRVAALSEAGDVIQAINRGQLREVDLIELGQVIADDRPLRGGWTVFKSVGVAAQDWAIARLAYLRKGKANCGPGEAPPRE
jgi:ornithine cyclodeaminase